MDDEQVSNFADITGANPRVARGYLDLAGGNLEQAIQLYFENPEYANQFNADPPPIPTHSRPAATAQSRSRNTVGREDSRGVIHLDSDDDGDANMTFDEDDEIEIPDDDDDDQGAVNAAVVARAVQEDEDAAMAKRLQEELYSEGPAGGPAAGEVRSPIARTTETLVAPAPGWSEEPDVMDSAVIREMMRRRQAAAPRAPNPFSQSVWEEPGAPSATPAFANGSRAQRLAELFRPPYDIMSNMLWDEARAEGKEQKKWIMVNLQDMSDFSCQALNRDIWKHEGIKALIKEHFIFLQHTKDDLRAREYTTFYFPHQSHENPDIYPHVSIVDPRTGEQVKVWSGKPFPTSEDFQAQLVEFLDRYSLAANKKNPVAKATSRPKVVDVDRMTEEEMLEMALQNSLETGGAGSSNATRGRPSVLDPDSFTKSSGTVEDGGKGKGKGKQPARSLSLGDTPTPEADQASTAAVTAADSSARVFAQIATDRPHVEPPNDPATTTRIQFRHPTGRVIRRFGLQEEVHRIYEWLRAEPLEGKDGVRFELKVMPQGRDLLGELGETIEAAGLKNGTVMIEFLEDDEV